MALNRDRLGATYPAYTYEVSREKIHEYARAVGETDPRYLSHGDDCVAPPTFAACFTIAKGAEAALTDPVLGAHGGLVHASQRYDYGGRAMEPGDVLRCVPRVADISARGDNEFLTIEVDCVFVDTGQLAVSSSTTLVLLGSAPATAHATTGDGGR